MSLNFTGFKWFGPLLFCNGPLKILSRAPQMPDYKMVLRALGADDLMTQGVKASVPMVLNKISTRSYKNT